MQEGRLSFENGRFLLACKRDDYSNATLVTVHVCPVGRSDESPNLPGVDTVFLINQYVCLFLLP